MSSLPPQIRVALLDDHAVVRYGTASRLAEEGNLLIVGSYETSRAMITGLHNAPADVLLVDYALGPAEIDGVSLIRALAKKFPDSAILVFSSHYDPATVALALRMGARGFVGKSQGMAQVVQAICKVATKAVYLDAEMSYLLAEVPTPVRAVMSNAEVDPAEKLIAGTSLSAKEREVIRCLLGGMTISEIAAKFNRSVKTISSQKSVAFRKLGVTSDIGLFKVMSTLEDQ
ncbi:DNA-binding response regulator [Achromobacter insolitus]|uniref:response regulator transcription factor n=1 Tax=Achromobacter insolitus TaxID=217204 RepID=UPI0007C6F9E4|nr:response regulator transcription factor [Achromobacter insolitus]OAE71651.1 DNA-binding response regulator [Achromobacter insolitus]OCZ52942.1 DNA-binding response regulator [Achromobacter insolitus]